MLRSPKQNDDIDVVMQETDQNVSCSPDRGSKRKNDNGALAASTPVVLRIVTWLGCSNSRELG
jgi:hypothetical protein